MSRLREFQLAFGRRIRAGARAPVPAGVPRQRMAVYEELLFNNLRSFLDRCFPVGRACLGELRWTRLCRAFYRDWPCATAWFREIPREFVDYLEAGSRPAPATLVCRAGPLRMGRAGRGRDGRGAAAGRCRGRFAGWCAGGESGGPAAGL
jgi:hypothetical protein